MMYGKKVSAKTMSKPSSKKSQPKPKVSGMYDFNNIYTGDPKKSPGVVKAKSDRAKSDSAVAAYKKKSDASKAKAIAVAKMKKK